MTQKRTFEKTFGNGLELVVFPTNVPVVSVQVWVDVGSIDENPIEAGFCHFLEHMLFKGTKKRTTAEIAGSIEGSGGEMNAFTSFEHTVYHITLSNKRWQLANEILADMVLGSIFDEDEFNPEKEVILEEIKRGDDSPDRQIYEEMYDSLYGKKGYGKPVIGFPKTVSKCTPQALKKFWKKWYHPELMTVVVCGDVDPVEVEKVIRKTWGRGVSKSAQRKRRRDIGFDFEYQKNSSLIRTKDFAMNSIRWVGAVPSCSIYDPEMPALDLSSSVLGSGEVSRLHQRLFRDENLVTSVGCGVWAPMGKGSYSFDVESSVEKGLRFKKAFYEEIERFCKEGPTTEEMDRAKITIETDRIYGSQTMDGLATRLGFLKTSTGNIHFDLEYLGKIKEVTPEDVTLLSRKFLQTQAMRECVLIPKGMDSKSFFMPSETQSKMALRDSNKVLKLHDKPEIVSLSNGIELALFPREDLPIVSIQSCTMGGLRAETRKNVGVGNLLSDVWEKGPRGMSSEDFNRFLESKASSIDAFSGRNSLGLSCTTLTHYVEDVLPYFTKTLFDPALEAREVEFAREVVLESIRTLEDSSARLVGKMFCETLFEGHPYMHPIIGYEDSVLSLKQESLIAHFRKMISSSRITVAVSGKFNFNHMVSHFEKIQRNNFDRSPSEMLPYQPPKASRLVEAKKNKEQSHIVCGFEGIPATHKDRYILRLLLTVFGGQSGRLFSELRDKQGLCYTVSPVSFEGIETGYVGVYIGCDPSKRVQAIDGIKRELEKISTKKISDKELKRAKEFMLGRQHMDMQLNSAIATASAFNSLYGLAFDEHEKVQEQVESITADQVLKFSKKLFSKPMVTAVVV